MPSYTKPEPDTGASVNRLYFGDNLPVLKEHCANESVDLIYLDPPFNSKRSYAQIFKAPDGSDSYAQIQAFEDTWHWGEQAEREYDEIVHCQNTDVSDLTQALRSFLHENDMMAYLVMMANRMLELHRVLKRTGSVYLHCDPTASHYLKLLMDAVFGVHNFRNEVVWRYQTGGAGKKQYAKKHDIILFYTKSDKYNFNPERIKIPRTEKSLKRAQNPTGARISSDDVDKLPDDVFDIQALNPMSKERLGYPTQKPLALLERIILASSDPGEIVLDPFCGCGTAMDAAQKLKRRWLGIDNTHLAIDLIEKRLKDRYPKIDYKVGTLKSTPRSRSSPSGHSWMGRNDPNSLILATTRPSKKPSKKRPKV